MSLPNWARVFGVSEDDHAELQNQLSGHDHPLRWMLANGHISTDEYIRWARDEFGLPSVKEGYFEVPADLVFWEAVKDEFQWTPWFFPLTQWEGVTLIGCLQPPDFHFPLHTPHRFVIASVHLLERRFSELEQQSQAAYQVEQEPIPPSHAPSEPEQDHDVNFTGAPPTAHVRQRPADEVLADDLPPAPDVSMRDPEGLLVDVDSNSHIDFAVPEGIQVNAQELKPVPTTPDGLEDASRIVDMDSLDFSQPAAPVPPPAEAPAAAPKVAPQPAAEAPRAPVVPPGPPPQAAQAPKADKVVMPPAPPPAPAPLRSNVSATEPAVPLATCTSIEALMSATVAHINVHFEHAMVLTYENAVLKPSKWSELLLSIKGDNVDPVSLDQPSIFRIAARTSLPYHGYVVANPTNTAFFNAFNRGALPKHVTIMPVMIAGQLTAMLMGMANEKMADYKGSLHTMEKLASDFSTQLERLREKQQSAA